MTEKRDKRIIFVRFVFWFGIIADFLNVLQYIFPASMIIAPFGLKELITPLARFILIQTASLMTAWTLLLLWAERNPIERRAILLLTVPIAIGIGYSIYFLIGSGAASMAKVVFLAGPIVTAGLFLSAYLLASRIHSKALESKSK